ncbi:hypothetical protein BDBG_02292 [Blastomyces gilchristii SLH14081]|uniref:M6 family metalloprotease domain-containing protein n=1 Tax=Blastomyces gilchristii (strain SLH14081) TaxID=559298 RepID=A0A179UDE9_BLAGS|nr:uncharacterized protein BDBG_02292 [Blastomyces gilchristii SLH14081]OAT05994.1 hypothetical protein BDBG_02292 [Blastomyces gilchristii SLH14081]
MKLPDASRSPWAVLGPLLTSALSLSLLSQPARAVPNEDEISASGGNHKPNDPFAVLDPQNWVNPDNMTWDDWKSPPGTNWADPTKRGSLRNFNIALVTVDYPNMPFAILQKPGSTIFGNPQPNAPTGLTREKVPAFYRDFLNKPSEVNHGHTLHEYWMTDSMGRYGVDLTGFGPYELPLKSFQYGIDKRMNDGACPTGETCEIDLRTDALGAWRADVGNETADSFELIFILSAGQDESATWQEFGEMRFHTPEDVTDEFGPPTAEDPNFAKTRYVDWTSWAAASTIWPNADGKSSTQSESSGMAVFAHELSHLLDIGDNYNNPYGKPPRRSYTGPWSMLSRGSFNGPGGPHSRWKIPPTQGGSMGSLHTLRDKVELKLVDNENLVRLSREGLPKSGTVVARLTARSVVPSKVDLMGIRIAMDSDKSPACDPDTDPFCDGGGYNGYDVEVIDRMGPDSFTPDSGVMISKTKSKSRGTYQWTIDANPQDLGVVDFYRPDGTPGMISLGDFRQLADALFHAGTRSGSEYEYVDKANGLHFYIIDIHRDRKGILSYTVAVRPLDKKDSHKRGIKINRGRVKPSRGNKPTHKGVTCSFKLRNTGSYSPASGGNKQHPQDISEYLKSDVYRLKATVKGKGWKVELPNALTTAKFGQWTTVDVAVAADKWATYNAEVKLTATSESDSSVVGSAFCRVRKYMY